MLDGWEEVWMEMLMTKRVSKGDGHLQPSFVR